MNRANMDDEINGYMDKINKDLGYYWWKRYIYTAFWNNISTPINLSIIILTALTTGQSATQNLITKELSTILGAVTLFVSIFNSYFKPYEQLTQNQIILKQWSSLGQEFEKIYYNRVYTLHERKVRLNVLEQLFSKVSKTRRDDDNNFCIDFLFIFIRLICIRDNITWLNETEIVQDRLRASKYWLTDVGVQVSIRDQPAHVLSIRDQPVAETELNLVITQEPSAEHNEFCMV
jgi:hypothetical protein